MLQASPFVAAFEGCLAWPSPTAACGVPVGPPLDPEKH
jgi:hypothetical protein